MTRESDHVEINQDRNPFLFSGTKVSDGYAKMLITSVGMNTTWGEMMSTISQDTNVQTPIPAQLDKLTSSIGKTASTIVVDAIPEGLPLAVASTLAYLMKRMMANQAMVRRHSACETMGFATTICTDKTGTFRLNQMKITKFWLGKECIEGKSYVSIAANVLELLQQGVSNMTGSVYMSSASGLEFYSSPTEKAILSWAVLELNMDTEKVKQNCSVLHVEAFNSEKKRSGILIKKVEDDMVHAHWKGAAEMILKRCFHYYNFEGNVNSLNNWMKFDQIIQGKGASSLRCIAFAHEQFFELEDVNPNG
ncbi:Calcium-transporting ATPase 12 [Abeliophyllum distichum]|uniref:Calcium-transporting ATPase 12 n=1 Tax=Abeliophyllum distichum TaxID=126358 RepID=A0ABD1T2M4_9LAMI